MHRNCAVVGNCCGVVGDWMIKKIMQKLGYMPIEEAKQAELRIRNAQNKETNRLWRDYKALESLRIGEIKEAIKNTRMVSVILEEFDTVMIMEDFGKHIASAPSLKTRNPVKPEYYAITTKIDLEAMRRIHDDLQYNRHSLEWDYFVDRFLYEIKSNLNTLIRVHH